MFKRYLLLAVPILSLALAGPPAAHAGAVWDDGDWHSSGGRGAERNGFGGLDDSYVYDDLILNAGSWTVTDAIGYFLSDTSAILDAEFEIRTGVSSGNGGTLVASGSASGMSVTPSWTDVGPAVMG